jgi:hypothetical protein
MWGEIIDTYRVWWIDLMERDQLEDLGVEGNIIFKWIFKKWDEETRSWLLWLKIETGDGLL